MVLTEGVASLLGAGVSGLSSLASGFLNSALSNQHMYRQYKYQKKLAKYSYNLERQSRQTSFGDTKQSLLDAGYNPMLALGQQSNSITPSMGSVSGSPAQVNLDPISAYSAISQVKQQDQAVANDTQRTENDALESFQRQALIKSQVDSQLLQNEINSATGMTKALDEVKLLEDQHVINQKQAKYIEKQIGLATTQSALNIAQAGQANSATVYQNMRNKQERDYMNWLDDHNPDALGSYGKTKRGIKYTGYTSRALGFNPLEMAGKGAVAGTLFKYMK